MTQRKRKPPPRVVPDAVPLSKPPELVADPGLGPLFDALTQAREEEEAASRACDEAERAWDEASDAFDRADEAFNAAMDRHLEARAALTEASAVLARARGAQCED